MEKTHVFHRASVAHKRKERRTKSHRTASFILWKVFSSLFNDLMEFRWSKRLSIGCNIVRLIAKPPPGLSPVDKRRWPVPLPATPPPQSSPALPSSRPLLLPQCTVFFPEEKRSVEGWKTVNSFDQRCVSWYRSLEVWPNLSGKKGLTHAGVTPTHRPTYPEILPCTS